MLVRKIGKYLIPLLVLLIIVSTSLIGAEGTATLKQAPFNEEFVNALANKNLLSQEAQDSSEVNKTGYFPSPISLKHLSRTVDTKMLKTVSLASSYDLRSLGKVTPVRDQGNAGSCWSFATYGSLESTSLPAETWDFSENNLKNTHGFDSAHDAGGNALMSAAYLSRWSGPIKENDDPYNDSSGVSPRGLSPVKHIQKVVFLPLRTSATDNAALKNAIVNYGAVYVAYYHNKSYYKSSTYSYYYNGSTSSNHAVTVVGWDDNYSKSNFAKTPSGNGAFIVKNSWGTSWGNNGYFYVSYYDKKFGYDENAQFLPGEATTNYTKVYQYDPLGWVASIGYSSDTGWFSNVFTSTGAASLSAVSFYTGSTSNSYTINIYTGVSGTPTSGTLVSTQTGTISESGYFTVELTTPVALSAGQKFSVVVKLTTTGYNYPIPIEEPYSGYSSAATASSGQSYVSSNGTTWTDLTTTYRNSNVNLKAFVK